MRELNASEITGVSGGGLTFTGSLTLSMLNDVATLSGVLRYASAAFSAGYAVGTYLDSRYNISSKIADLL